MKKMLLPLVPFVSLAMAFIGIICLKALKFAEDAVSMDD